MAVGELWPLAVTRSEQLAQAICCRYCRHTVPGSDWMHSGHLHGGAVVPVVWFTLRERVGGLAAGWSKEDAGYRARSSPTTAGSPVQADQHPLSTWSPLQQDTHLIEQTPPWFSRMDGHTARSCRTPVTTGNSNRLWMLQIRAFCKQRLATFWLSISNELNCLWLAVGSMEDSNSILLCYMSQ